MAIEDEYSQPELNALRNSQPDAKQMCDMVVLPCITYKACCGIQDGLKAVHQATRNACQGRTAVIQLRCGQHSDQRQQYRLANCIVVEELLSSWPLSLRRECTWTRRYQ